MILKNKTEILPGWTLSYDEVSNNVYEVTLTDNFGRLAATTDTDFEKAVVTCENYVFDIERQTSKSWNKFLFDKCILKTNHDSITKSEYHYEAFGSWYIEYGMKRIVLDGKDYVLHSQVLNENDWVDLEQIKLSELTFDEFEKLINSVS